jgi:hypothetical protein
MASDRILLIPNIGTTLMREIAQYRERETGAARQQNDAEE